tara:strand:- start:197 stop:403 length:207 start_codon:yes stop_codon:yes gene_type:complete
MILRRLPWIACFGMALALIFDIEAGQPMASGSRYALYAAMLLIIAAELIPMLKSRAEGPDFSQKGIEK